MSRATAELPLPLALLTVILISSPFPSAQTGTAGGLSRGEWIDYAGDAYGMKYSPLALITPQNVGQLEVAWRWPSADQDLQKSNPLLRASRYEDTPLMVNGVLYTATPLGLIAALDPATGHARWVYDPKSYVAGRHGNAGFKTRGLAYWTDGSEERVLLGTNDAYLVSVDAKAGLPDPKFGVGGKVDITVGIRDARRAFNISARRALIAGNIAVVASSILDPTTTKEAPPGYVHAFDVRSGTLLWTFHTVPRPGEFGSDTWLDNSAEYTGNTNVWAGMAYDPELDYLYLRTSTPTNDWYGGHRPGDNLFAESLVCVEAKTGKRVWHFQAVHHGLWDYDFPSHPTLGDVTVNGQRIKAVMQISKQNWVYAFDRRTGRPLWPIEERLVEQSTVPGERTARTQPFPTKPASYDLQGATEENLIDFTPELKKRALAQLQTFKHGPLFTPPSEQGTLVVPGPLGGAN